MKITQINNRFLVETPDTRLHMLNEKSLTYFLKNQLKLNKVQRIELLNQLDEYGSVTLVLEAA